MSYNFPEEEQKILKFWQENQIFEKLRQKNALNPSKRSKHKRWSFLDGPITANNPMGVHHAWGRTYKDVRQRYKAMQGFDQRYQNGFDCQGLWVEVEVEKELGFKTKKDIETYGIGQFVQKCKERVQKYAAIQTAQSIRLGQWMDWENSYFTMSDENNYAIWAFLKKCHEKGYLYKGRDSVPWCPRCGTAISQHEILTEEYKEIVHDSIYFALPITGHQNEFLLVWTTTPWTLPANIAVAVDEKIDYALVDNGQGKFWVAKDLAEKIFKGVGNIVKTAKGKKLVGLKYTFAFDDLPKVKEAAQKNPDNFHTVIATDDRIMPINIEDGTGLVHTAVSAGQEDFQLGKKLGLPLIEVIGEDATYLDGLGEFSGQNAKKDPKVILDYLARNDAESNAERRGKWVFEILPYQHKYPTCWRCKTELVWRVVDEWYIAMDQLREPLRKMVESINWIPEFCKERELDWINNMHDWLISKKRYWGLALPIFECQACGHFEVIGSKEELKKRAVQGWEEFDGQSPHRPWVDAVQIECRGVFRDPDSGKEKKCKKPVSRIKDVGNPWLDAGIVPFSTLKYFEDKKYWKQWFPAEMVSESFPGQFKNWFYSLLVMSAVLEDTAPMKTIFGYASVKDEKGEEMHKSKGNAIWFDEAVEKVGADPMRWFYMRANPAENVNFGYKALDDTKKKLLTLYNVYSFFGTYVTEKETVNLPAAPSANVLDRWIISKLGHVISVVEFNLEKYDTAKAVQAMEDFFINDLSLWYLRRSRKRFHEGAPGRQEAVATLRQVLLGTAKILAPIVPFFAEANYQYLKTEGMPESVHLCDWPSATDNSQTDLALEQDMDSARAIVGVALAERAAKAIKVRQPLAALTVKNTKSKIKDNAEILAIIKDEVNVKEIIFDGTIESEVQLDTKLTEALKEEGLVRDLVRLIQDLRKEQGLKPEDKVSLSIWGSDALAQVIQKNKDLLLQETRSVTMTVNEGAAQDSKELSLEGEPLLIKVTK